MDGRLHLQCTLRLGRSTNHVRAVSLETHNMIAEGLRSVRVTERSSPYPQRFFYVRRVNPLTSAAGGRARR